MNPTRIMLVEDDMDFCYLIAQVLGEQPDLELTGTCGTCAEALAMALREQPDLVLMDLSLANGGDGAEAARRIRLRTDAKIIILTAYDAPEKVIGASVQAFASAYVCKSQFSLLLPTIRETAAGPTPQSYLICSVMLQTLSPAEQIVFQRMIGREVGINSSPKTIANQQTSILHKLGFANRQEFNHVLAAYYPRPAVRFP